MKTAKCVDVTSIALGDAEFRGITVSTLAEAEYFAAAGYRDITYAVGVVPSKLERLEALDADVGVLVDDPSVAQTLAGRKLRVWIEIDCGGRRGGVDPEGDALLEIAGMVKDRLAGVITHAGQSYGCESIDEVARVAEQERAAAVRAAERVRAQGIACEGVSVGSTPTAVHARSLEGVTELRAGVYVFFDLFQRSIGSCGPDDLALSVVASVISTRGGAVWIDAGALALSTDRSMDRFGGGYGRVTALDGTELPGAPRVGSVHQEHGRLDADAELPLHVGDQVRIWPNHACMTAAMYDAYQVGDAIWPRLRG